MLSAAAVLLAVHPPLDGACYGFVDDYVLLDERRGFPDWPFLAWTARDGRPLYGLLLNLLMLPFGDVCDLGLLRSLNILLEVVIATQVLVLAARHGWSWPASVALGLLLAALPGFAVAAAWPTLVGPLVAISLGLAAAGRAVRPHGATVSSRQLAPAALVLAAALAVYQPGAMAFVTGVAIALMPARMSGAEIRNRLLPAALLFATVVGTYALSFLALPALLPAEVISPRAELVMDPWGKAVWFLGVPLRQALNLFNLQPVPRFGVFILALVAAGTLACQRRLAPAVLSLAMQAGLVILSFLPNLIVAESWPAFRSALPMSMTVAVLAAAAVTGVARHVAGRFAAPLAAALIAAAAAYGLAVTTEAAEHGLVRLQQEEWRALTAALREAGPASGAGTVALVAAGSVPECAAWQRFDEFGLPSTARPWAAEAMFRHAWREVHGAMPVPRLVITASAADPQIADATIIDMPGALSARAGAICGSRPLRLKPAWRRAPRSRSRRTPRAARPTSRP